MPAVKPEYETWWAKVRQTIAKYGRQLPVELTIAQAHYESVADGKPSTIALNYNNLFGIKKAHDNRFQSGAVDMKTKEWTPAGKEVGTSDAFATYQDFDHSVLDLIRITGYESFRKNLPANPVDKERAWAEAFHAYGYSTKPDYADDLLARRDTLRKLGQPPAATNKAPVVSAGNKLPLVTDDKEKPLTKLFGYAKTLIARLVFWGASKLTGTDKGDIDLVVSDAVRNAEHALGAKLGPDKLRLALDLAKPKVEALLHGVVKIPFLGGIANAAIDRAIGKLIDQAVAKYEHLPEKLQRVSKPFGDLAREICDTLPSNPERTVGLRKLLEAKDCTVRALLYQEPA